MLLYMLSVGLLLLGITILVLELFIPSGGVLGVLAAMSFVASIVVAFFADPKFGAIMLAVTSILIPVMVATGVHFWPNTPLGKLILIPRPQSDADILPDGLEYRQLKTMVGKRGKAQTKMLPGGVVSIDGQTFDAISQGMAIEQGAGVLVVAVRTNRIVVRQLDPGEKQAEPTVGEVLAQPVEAVVLDPFQEPLA